MKILFCNYEYPPLGGGGGVYNAWLAQELAKRHEVTVLTSQGLGLPRESVESGVRVLRVPVFFRKREAVANILSLLAYIPMGIHKGKWVIADHPVDVINTHFVLPSGPVGDALSKFGHIPNILSLHGGDLFDPSKFSSPHRHAVLRFWIRTLIKRATRVVGQSNNTLENMKRFYLPDMNGVRIPLGIPRPRREFATRSQFGLTEKDILTVTVGRLVPRKRVGELISLMHKLRDVPVHLFVIGSGPEENVLKNDSREKGVNKRVHFLGNIGDEEKLRILNMCDFYVSTSQHEGFGLVFLEAMASGLPIVCFNVGGQTDFLEGFKTGFLVPLNDMNLFEERCRLLIKDSNLRFTIGKENLKRVEEYYIDRCAVHYEALFELAVESGKRGILNGHPHWA